MCYFTRPSCTSAALCFFFFNDTATTEIYTLSLHDALPISELRRGRAGTENHAAGAGLAARRAATPVRRHPPLPARRARSEEHTSELQSPDHLVCRLLLEKKKKTIMASRYYTLPRLLTSVLL